MKYKKFIITFIIIIVIGISSIFIFNMNKKQLLPEIKANELVEVVNGDGTTKLISMDEYNNGTYQTLTQKNVNDIKAQKEAEAKAQEEARIKAEQEAKAQAEQQAQASANNYNSNASSSTRKPASNGGSQSKPSTSTGGGSTQTPSTPSRPQQPQPEYFATLPFYVDTVFDGSMEQALEFQKVQQWFHANGFPLDTAVSAWTDGSYGIYINGYQYTIEAGSNIVTRMPC